MITIWMHLLPASPGLNRNASTASRRSPIKIPGSMDWCFKWIVLQRGVTRCFKQVQQVVAEADQLPGPEAWARPEYHCNTLCNATPPPPATFTGQVHRLPFKKQEFSKKWKVSFFERLCHHSSLLFPPSWAMKYDLLKTDTRDCTAWYVLYQEDTT